MELEPTHSWKWRIRAEELRVRAAVTRDLKSRETYLMLADYWDVKADTGAAALPKLAAAK
jgi:hypothetical protein